MRSIQLAFAALAFGATAAHAAKPQIQWDPDYDFSSIRTFQWADPRDVSLENSDPFLHAHINNAIEYQLTSHGLTEVEANPDVLVTYHSSVDTDVRLQSSTVGYGFGNYRMRGWGYYGYGMGGPVYTDTRVAEVQRGTLIVDIVDASDNELIWRGKVDNITVSADAEKTHRNVEKAIERMAKQADKLREKNE